ncbi:hypothetical protein Tco_1094428 [Tanacetum coccineum]|uniref:Uncharacterized protein n=1 Tax=Tanacetum coccineum TaxID=301880 RepID=A0ABQ5IGQ1_9ASTR
MMKQRMMKSTMKSGKKKKTDGREDCIKMFDKDDSEDTVKLEQDESVTVNHGHTPFGGQRTDYSGEWLTGKETSIHLNLSRIHSHREELTHLEVMRID